MFIIAPCCHYGSIANVVENRFQKIETQHACIFMHACAATTLLAPCCPYGSIANVVENRFQKIETQQACIFMHACAATTLFGV